MNDNTPTPSIEETVQANVGKAIMKDQEGPKNSDGCKDAKILYAVEPTFRVPIVYAYGDFETYKKLNDALFCKVKPAEVSAKGYTTFGPPREEIGSALVLIWINNEVPLKNTMPTAMHEITHLSQDIMEYAGVQDQSGEVQAYIVQREFERLMRELYGMEGARDNDLTLKTMKDAVEGRLANPTAPAAIAA